MNQRKDIKLITESEAIRLSKEDTKYFGVLYDKYFEQIFRFVFKRLGGLEDVAGDLTQLTFMKAMGNIGKYEDRGLPFSSWLYRIAQNEVSMYFRKESKTRKVPVDENRIKDLASEAQLTNYMSMDDQQLLINIINDLDETELDLIELRFFQQMSFKEIAEIYNITEANAKMRTYRLLERIEKKWSPE